jgi:hypothetical protein
MTIKDGFKFGIGFFLAALLFSIIYIVIISFFFGTIIGKLIP